MCRNTTLWSKAEILRGNNMIIGNTYRYCTLIQADVTVQVMLPQSNKSNTLNVTSIIEPTIWSHEVNIWGKVLWNFGEKYMINLRDLSN